MLLWTRDISCASMQYQYYECVRIYILSFVIDKQQKKIPKKSVLELVFFAIVIIYVKGLKNRVYQYFIDWGDYVSFFSSSMEISAFLSMLCNVPFLISLWLGTTNEMFLSRWWRKIWLPLWWSTIKPNLLRAFTIWLPENVLLKW